MYLFDRVNSVIVNQTHKTNTQNKYSMKTHANPAEPSSAQTLLNIAFYVHASSWSATIQS